MQSVYHKGLKLINTPGTVSKILWHFTGGPIWNETENKQNESLKPHSVAYENIKSILSTKELWLGNYKEIVRVVVRRKINKNSLFYEEGMPETKQTIVISSSPVCCVADIPIQHLNYHSDRYGKMAIGFYRDSIVTAGFNPVLYTLEHSQLINSIYKGFEHVQNYDTFWTRNAFEEIQEQVELLIEQNEDNEKIDYTEIENAIDDVENVQEKLAREYEKILSFIKTFNSSEFNSIYCEREWRSTITYHFTESDIAMVILPKNIEGTDYYSLYLSENNLSENVPIIPWEDLVEH